MGYVLRHEDCWAKTTKDGQPGINVRNHCVNVGCVAEALLALLPPQLRKNLVPSGSVVLAALHDLGKVSPGFQSKCNAWLTHHSFSDIALKEGWKLRVSDHAKISQFTVQSLLRDTHGQRWAASVGAHHGRIKGERVQLSEPWEEERTRLAAELVKAFGPLPDELPVEASQWFVAGLITVADWIGSDEKHFQQSASGDLREQRLRAQMALEEIHWVSVRARHLNGFTDLFPEISQPNDLQSTSVQAVNDPGVYVIEGPMGSGKTEAALAAAYQLIRDGKATGLYFALPTQLTSNRVYLRVQPFVERMSSDPAGVRLVHGTSWLADIEAPTMLYPASADAEAQEHARAGRSWFSSSKRALLAAFGVGTIDQALLGIVAAKHFFVRQFGLAGKVVILDEVHTYDLYTSTLIGELVKRLRELQSTVIILSATLTKSRRRELLGLGNTQTVSAAYPLVSGEAHSFIERECIPPPSKTFQIKNISGVLPIQQVMERAYRGECLLWIRNTVGEAQQTYRALQSANREGGLRIALLHSRFPFFRREQLEDEWMNRLGKDSTNRPEGCVLVSTQVAEQSVDIDADLLLTDLAPTDMLLQRMGRLWRHERTFRPCSQPEVWILMPHLADADLRDGSESDLRHALGKSARVYAPYVLLRSLQQWRTRQTITFPGDIRAILEATYAEPATCEPIAWRSLRDQLEREKGKMAQQALNAANVWNNPALPDDEGVQTRLSTYPMAQLLLATEITSHDPHSAHVSLLNGSAITANDREWDFDAAKSIYRNLVRVPRWAVAAGLLQTPPWLVNHVAQPTALAILQRNGEIHWPSHGEPTGMSYHPDQGIIININPERMARAPSQETDESYD